ncbi:hypothetical protein PPERSA_11315 [Pseudocohnilembus persalinus]|uniref:Uncharacterized protein n=1 Tax=Pseudocohnilembus persalinus TaxID=266149 RepID=A0A0V0QPA9_PSEPJ|nr:hypothetical protein PPERSA_11315 [Pseudocohnilembus persalinus]|eukprot:KRX04191.1 hypothetical protein PPERSA_11315 [Pseudocohnilembus persalinus]
MPPKNYKKWCEYCRLMILASEFNQHLKTRRHTQNKERELEFQRNKARKLRLEQERLEKEKDYVPDAIKQLEKKAKLAMAEQEKDEEQIKKYYKGDMDGDFDNPVKQNYKAESFMEKADYSQSLSYKDKELYEELNQEGQIGSKLEKVWNLVIDKESESLGFYNSISQKFQTKKPIGLKLSQREQEIWENQEVDAKDILIHDVNGDVHSQHESDDNEENNLQKQKEQKYDELKEKLKEQQKDKPDQNRDETKGVISSKWEVVEEEEDLFAQNQVGRNLEARLDGEESDEFQEQNNQGHNDGESQDKRLTLGEILDEQKRESEAEKVLREINEGKDVSEREMFEALVSEEARQQGGMFNQIKFKNEKLKKMVEKDVALPSSYDKTMFKKKDFLGGNNDIKDEKKNDAAGSKGFKKRVLNSKKTVKLQFED